MTDWTTIRVRQDAKDEAAERKPDDMDWSEWFRRDDYDPSLDVADLRAVTATPEDLTKLRSELLERLERIESAATTAESAAQSNGRKLEELR